MAPVKIIDHLHSSIRCPVDDIGRNQHPADQTQAVDPLREGLQLRSGADDDRDSVKRKSVTAPLDQRPKPLPRLGRRKSSRPSCSPERRVRVEHATTTDGGDRAPAPQYKSIAPARHRGCLEAKPRQAALTRTDGAAWQHSNHYLRCSEVKTGARASYQWALRRGEKCKLDVDRCRRRPGRIGGDQNLPSRNLRALDSGESQCDASARLGLAHSVTVRLDRTHAGIDTPWQEAHCIAHCDRSRPCGARHHRTDPGDGKCPIDRKPEEIGSSTRSLIDGVSSKPSSKLRNSLPGYGRHDCGRAERDR